jgi:hypothetical protein
MFGLGARTVRRSLDASELKEGLPVQIGEIARRNAGIDLAFEVSVEAFVAAQFRRIRRQQEPLDAGRAAAQCIALQEQRLNSPVWGRPCVPETRSRRSFDPGWRTGRDVGSKVWSWRRHCRPRSSYNGSGCGFGPFLVYVYKRLVENV